MEFVASSICHLHCATHGYHGPELSFTVTGLTNTHLLLNGICGRNVELFHFRICVNDLRDNLCCWFSLHVTSGHCSHLICMCTYHLHII